MFKRRGFLSALGLMGAAGLAPVQAANRYTFRKNWPGADAELFKCKPYLQNLSENKAIIRWLTNRPCNSWVEYGESPDKLTQIAHTTFDGFIQANNTNNRVVLNNLKPDSKYYYRVVSKEMHYKRAKVSYETELKGPVFSFKTINPKAAEVDFLVFNDIHDRPESFPLLMKFQEGGPKDFVFLNGDMFNMEESEDQLVNHLIAPLTDLFASETPFIYSRGNHEFRGPFARHLGEYFDGRGDRFYFSFQQGPMYAIVVDSGEDKADDDPAYAGINDCDDYREEQKRWLEQEVEKPAFKNAKYKVVFSHIPLYHNADDSRHGNSHCRELWNPIFNKAKIDIMISGHKHVHGIFKPIQGKHNYPIVIGGGPLDGQRTLIQVKADKKAFSLVMKDETGKVIHTLSV